MNLKRILALIALILLGGLYIAIFILALFGNQNTLRLLGVAIALTIIIPIVSHLLLMMQAGKDGKNVFTAETYSYKEKKSTSKEATTSASADENKMSQ
ncbi:MAG: hypothetical protein IJ791_07120 [Lachnospiraceae bacterium]|nr:hypothetical protein [Lachnospiraceae bacterium]